MRPCPVRRRLTSVRRRRCTNAAWCCASRSCRTSGPARGRRPLTTPGGSARARPRRTVITRCVQLIGLNDPDRRWLLKNPGHIEHLDLLLAVFPDARVIQTHRDPGRRSPASCPC
ncbi:sulfotransferase family protein [Novosphingobium panipatense]